MKKAVLFDIDGTILDAKDFVFKARDYSLAFHGYAPAPKKKLKEAMGKPLVEFYQMILSETDVSKIVQTHIKFQEKNFPLIKPFPNTQKVLKFLKTSGFAVAAVSNRTRQSLLHSLKLAEIFKYFDAVVSAEDVKNPKPHKEHLLVTLDLLKVLPANSYMVGDTDQDILAGKNANVKTIGATYGWLGKDIKKHNPDFIIDDIKELLEIIS